MNDGVEGFRLSRWRIVDSVVETRSAEMGENRETLLSKGLDRGNDRDLL